MFFTVVLIYRPKKGFRKVASQIITFRPASDDLRHLSRSSVDVSAMHVRSICQCERSWYCVYNRCNMPCAQLVICGAMHFLAVYISSWTCFWIGIGKELAKAVDRQERFWDWFKLAQTFEGEVGMYICPMYIRNLVLGDRYTFSKYCGVIYLVFVQSRCLRNWVNNLQFLTRILKFGNCLSTKARRKDVQKKSE